MVQRAAGRGDDDVHPALQRPELADDRLAAVDRQRADAEVAAVAVDGLGDLRRQLARRDQDERARRAAVGAAAEALQQRQRERRGLAGAGGRLAEQVAPFQQRRDGLALDRRGLLVAEGGEGGDQLGGEGEVREADGVAVG